MEKNNSIQIRDGIFNLKTRRFGTVAEILIKKVIKAKWSNKGEYDLNFEENRIEVKFSTALKSHDEKISESNILKILLSEGDKEGRMFSSTQWKEYPFDCNIQQVKKDLFDQLFYGIFFSDRVVIFKINTDEIGENIKYSDKQHYGNTGEGQFHLTNATYQFHKDNFFFVEYTYEELLKILSE